MTICHPYNPDIVFLADCGIHGDGRPRFPIQEEIDEGMAHRHLGLSVPSGFASTENHLTPAYSLPGVPTKVVQDLWVLSAFAFSLCLPSPASSLLFSWVVLAFQLHGLKQ